MSRASASLEREREEPPARVAAAPDPQPVPPSAATRDIWLAVGLLASVMAWIVAWHGDAAARMAATWWRSDTFAHGLIVYPVALWLIWRERQRLAEVPLRAWPLGLLPLAAAALLVLLGTLGGVEAARQFGLVAMLPLAVVAILGRSIGRALAFPLAFTLMAVPIGEFLLPVLMQHTADFTVAALRFSGIPVYREGLFFTLPSGRWSVVEACSGLRYLIASATLGLLYAYLTYRSPWRRAAFVLASIVVPIVANWFRAYMIVMIGHLSDMRLAVGVDHLIYGWVFFGVVMLLLFWVGAMWREPEAAKADAKVGEMRSAGKPGLVMIGVALGSAAVAAAGPLYVARLDAALGSTERALSRPAAASGWQPGDDRLPRFRPHFLHARDSATYTYEQGGRQVGVFIAYYAKQREGAELIGFGNDLLRGDERGWLRVAERARGGTPPAPAVVETRLQSEREQLLVWRWYWTGGEWALRPEEVKLRQALGRLLGRGDDAAVVIVYTNVPVRDDAAAVLERFTQAMADPIRQALEQARDAAR